MTGFYAYWIYVAVKNIHFGSKKFNIMDRRLPQKARFLNSWNQGRKDRDGMMFLKVMEKMSSRKEDYIRLFAAYYMKDPNFHVSAILSDNFQTYRANELELTDILETAKSDYLTAILYCFEREMRPEDMFYSTNGHYKTFPFIYRLYDQGKISHNSLIAFHEVFGIGSKIQVTAETNIVDAEKAKGYRLIFDKYSPIVYHYFQDIQWKPELQKYHKHILKLRV
jgi:hypothetical protein